MIVSVAVAIIAASLLMLLLVVSGVFKSMTNSSCLTTSATFGVTLLIYGSLSKLFVLISGAFDFCFFLSPDEFMLSFIWFLGADLGSFSGDAGAS